MDSKMEPRQESMRCKVGERAASFDDALLCLAATRQRRRTSAMTELARLGGALGGPWNTATTGWCASALGPCAANQSGRRPRTEERVMRRRKPVPHHTLVVPSFVVDGGCQSSASSSTASPSSSSLSIKSGGDAARFLGEAGAMVDAPNEARVSCCYSGLDSRSSIDSVITDDDLDLDLDLDPYAARKRAKRRTIAGALPLPQNTSPPPLALIQPLTDFSNFLGEAAASTFTDEEIASFCSQPSLASARNVATAALGCGRGDVPDEFRDLIADWDDALERTQRRARSVPPVETDSRGRLRRRRKARREVRGGGAGKGRNAASGKPVIMVEVMIPGHYSSGESYGITTTDDGDHDVGLWRKIVNAGVKCWPS